jgi:hypothetical protein
MQSASILKYTKFRSKKYYFSREKSGASPLNLSNSSNLGLGDKP